MGCRRQRSRPSKDDIASVPMQDDGEASGGTRNEMLFSRKTRRERMENGSERRKWDGESQTFGWVTGQCKEIILQSGQEGGFWNHAASLNPSPGTLWLCDLR